MDIQREAKTTMLFISHDLSVVRYIADRVVVMYLGHIVEQGTTDEIFSPPYHPYTSLLISSVPELRRNWLSELLDSRDVLEELGGTKLPLDQGCAFRTRCPLVVEGRCDSVTPPARRLGEDGRHVVNCHREIEELAAVVES